MLDEFMTHEIGARRSPQRAPDRDFEHSVLELLEYHGSREGAILESYRRVAERSPAGGAIRYLVQLILDDEQRHHLVFDEMANAIRSFVWEVPVEPRLPALGAHSDPELLAETERLLAFEQRDRKDLRRLRKSLRGSPESSLDPLMVELMLLDTDKHIAILEHVKSRLVS